MVSMGFPSKKQGLQQSPSQIPLLQGYFGSVLYTGDFRLHSQHAEICSLQMLRDKELSRIGGSLGDWELASGTGTPEKDWRWIQNDSKRRFWVLECRKLYNVFGARFLDFQHVQYVYFTRERIQKIGGGDNLDANFLVRPVTHRPTDMTIFLQSQCNDKWYLISLMITTRSTRSLCRLSIGWRHDHFLVGGDWNMTFIFRHIGNNHLNWRTYIFQRGMVYHQPVVIQESSHYLVVHRRTGVSGWFTWGVEFYNSWGVPVRI